MRNGSDFRNGVSESATGRQQLPYTEEWERPRSEQTSDREAAFHEAGHATFHVWFGVPWQATYRDPSGRERAKLFERKVDAERWLASVQHELHSGSYVDPTAAKVTHAGR